MAAGNNHNTLQSIIANLYNKEVFPISLSKSDDARLIKDLCNATLDAIHKMALNPIHKRRPNEVGNAIEVFIKNARNELKGYSAETPSTIDGVSRSSGYPDILIKDPTNRYSYIECKTYTEKTLNSKFRSFFLSPSSAPKVIYDAHHIVIAMQMKHIKTNVYMSEGFKIIDVCHLPCILKQEWNSNNVELYNQPILASKIYNSRNSK